MIGHFSSLLIIDRQAGRLLDRLDCLTQLCVCVCVCVCTRHSDV